MGGTELEVLRAVRKKGGETRISAIAAEIRLSSDYARLVCRGLGMDDCLDVFKNGRVRLTEKGMAALRKLAPSSEAAVAGPEEAGGMKTRGSAAERTDGETEEDKPLSPDERYRRWISTPDASEEADACEEGLGAGDGKEANV